MALAFLTSPVDLYPAVKNLQNLVRFDFSFPKRAAKNPLSGLPEVQLVSLIVIASKLLFPFDDTKRYPFSANESTTQAVNWKAWNQAQWYVENREIAAGHIGKGNEILATEDDAFTMTGTQLDEYMDWYENSWLDSKGTKLLVPFQIAVTNLRSNQSSHGAIPYRAD